MLEAGPILDKLSVSVSPIDVESDTRDEDEDEEEEVVGEFPGEDLERIRPEKDDDFIRKLIDPKLPSEEEVKMHWMRGHVEYRNWCGICVRARGRN